MTPEEITDFTVRLTAETSPQEAYFGIFQYGGGPDESCIRANKQGLQLFAAKLLSAAAQVDETLAHETQTIIPFEDEVEDSWLDGDVFVQYIEPLADRPAPLPTPTVSSTLLDTLMTYALQGGVFILLIGLVVGIVNGLRTIAGWIFG
ncbi:hypothetical protein [Hymenobacter chitinivorans]|uniref:Uncharacterized protein n=1 Tax=Hymenobacter chitinivorans DSM 11115 TaxID=1121954 RepID=A0A2M9BMX7_9BACT|nr:hypothetical protein [Hymenobacter chitinivorans]PJJ59250.1 hypothetical protein CLV45_0666 [Hymenobacter chitinivorans DSM 11115]